MKLHSLFILLAGFSASASAALIDGYCYLENQMSHEGVRVIFEANSPTAVTDSTFTSVNGYYQLDVQDGIYDVHYFKPGFEQHTIPSQNCYNPLTLPEVTLEDMGGIEISGPLLGVLEAGTYFVVDDISIVPHSTLTIEPGTTLLFDYNKHLRVDTDCRLVCNGTESDSIRFLSNDDNNLPSMTMLKFGASTENNIVSYSVISEGTTHIAASNVNIHHTTVINTIDIYYASAPIDIVGNSTVTIANCLVQNNTSQHTGAISCDRSNITVDSCIIKDNVSEDSGSIVIYRGDVNIRNTLISNNVSNSFGGGIYCVEADPTIENCIITSNTASNGGGGIVCYTESDATIINCKISNNHVTTYSGSGGGIFCDEYSNPTIEYCEIYGNTVYQNGGGIYCESVSDPVINKCTIVNNVGGGVYCKWWSDPTIINSIITSNDGYGIGAFEHSDPYVAYCDVYDNITGNFGGDSIEIAYGLLVTTNANGDSCDAWFNIEQDPVFDDPDNNTYYIQSTSPCIDAGDPNADYDPDNTIADIGAHYFDPTNLHAPEDDNESTMRPPEFGLSNPYPNPFNSTVNLMLSTLAQATLDVAVFDILGRVVDRFPHSVKSAGQHVISLHADDKWSSGIYLVVVSSQSGFTACQKLVLLK